MILRRWGARLLVVTLLTSGAACASPAGAPEEELTQIARTPPAPTATASPTATPTSTPEPAAAAPTPTFVPASDGASVTISAVGDISLARQVNDWMEQYGASYPYELVQPLLAGDIVFGNLEGAITDGGEPWPKAFTFRTPPRFASGLSAAGFDIVSLANNHAMDYGVTGLTDTIAALNQAGVAYAGAGGCGSCAALGKVVSAHGLNVAFVACVRTPNEGTGFSIEEWSMEAQRGLFVCSSEEIASAVEGARQVSDFVVVSIHAGDEYVNAPNATQRELAEAALAAGADVVLGHHAHVVQPVEQRGNQLIAWGLGNFIFDLDQWDLAGIPEPRVSLILNITLTKGVGVTGWEAVPVTLDAEADRPRPATADEAAVLQQLVLP